jgi:hypothetical protein
MKKLGAVNYCNHYSTCYFKLAMYRPKLLKNGKTVWRFAEHRCSGITGTRLHREWPDIPQGVHNSPLTPAEMEQWEAEQSNLVTSNSEFFNSR